MDPRGPVHRGRRVHRVSVHHGPRRAACCGTGDSLSAARKRIAAAFVVALLAATYAGTRAWVEPYLVGDLDHQLYATSVMLSGGNPYTSVGPGTGYRWIWPLYYPGPALVVLVPFTLLPLVVARVLFASVTAGALCYATTKHSYHRLPLFLSASMLLATSRAQWAPLLLAAVWWPWLGGVMGAKPNIGLAMMAGWARRQWRAVVISGAVMWVVSLLLYPEWPVEWLKVLRVKHDAHIPLLEMGGFLMPLALTRWRRPEARVLMGLSVTPQTPSLYDTLPLFVVSRTVRESTILALCSHALFLCILALGPFSTFDGYAAALADVTPVAMYLPALWMVVRRRNESAPLDAEPRALTRTDAWLLALLVLVAITTALGTIGAARYQSGAAALS